MMELEQWFADFDLIDEQYAAIMARWPDSLNELNEERKMLKNCLSKYPSSEENNSINTEEFIAAIEAEMPRIERGDLLNILSSCWTVEPGDELTEKTTPRKRKQEAAIMAAFATLNINPMSTIRGDRQQVMQQAIDDSHPLLTESTAPKAYQRCLDKRSIAKSM